jgi:hypothetical protein
MCSKSNGIAPWDQVKLAGVAYQAQVHAARLGHLGAYYFDVVAVQQ